MKLLLTAHLRTRCSTIAKASNDTDGMHSATMPELVRTWTMICQSAPPNKDRNSPCFYPHQVVRFLPNGAINNSVSQDPITESQLAIWRQARSGATYKIKMPGVLMITRSPGWHECVIVSAVTADQAKPFSPGAPRLRKGDLTFMYHLASPVPRDTFGAEHRATFSEQVLHQNVSKAILAACAL